MQRNCGLLQCPASKLAQAFAFLPPASVQRNQNGPKNEQRMVSVCFQSNMTCITLPFFFLGFLKRVPLFHIFSVAIIFQFLDALFEQSESSSIE